MKLPIIYSDQDGVLADFYAGAAKVLGHPWDSENISAGRKADQGRLLEQHEGFWEHLPPMKDLQVYWGFIEKFSPHILTAVPQWNHDYHEVYAGKWAWVRKHLPGFPQSRFHVVTRAEKANYARTGQVSNILIDDFKKNVIDFQNSGGIGIWHVSAKVTILKLKEFGYH